jgi:hypothetical protein
MDVQKHINTTIHLSNQCKVLKALAKSMPRQAIAMFDRNKRKYEQPKENGGDFHVLMAHAVSMSIKLAKANKNKHQKHTKQGIETTLTLKRRVVKISILGSRKL